MRWLLDTNVIIDAFSGQPAATKAIVEARSKNLEWVGFSAITRLEALGYWKLTKSDEAGLRKLLAQFSEITISTEIIEEAIRLRKVARVKTPDAIVAATALVHNASLVTRNTGDFTRMPGLGLIDTATI